MNISDFGLAHTSAAWGQHVIVKRISHLICLPIMTDYLWPVKHKLSMWWFKSGAPRGHMLGAGLEPLPTWCEKHSGYVLKHHGMASVATLRPHSLWKASKLYKIPSVQWTCCLKWLGFEMPHSTRELDSRAVSVTRWRVERKFFFDGVPSAVWCESCLSSWCSMTRRGTGGEQQPPWKKSSLCFLMKSASVDVCERVLRR